MFLPKISKQVLIPGHNIWEEEGAEWRVTQPQYSASKGLQEVWNTGSKMEQLWACSELCW